MGAKNKKEIKKLSKKLNSLIMQAEKINEELISLVGIAESGVADQERKGQNEFAKMAIPYPHFTPEEAEMCDDYILEAEELHDIKEKIKRTKSDIRCTS